MLNACKNLIEDRLIRLAKVEAAGVSRIFKTKKTNVVGALAKFYDGHRLKLADALMPAIGVADKASGINVVIFAPELAEKIAADGLETSTKIAEECITEEHLASHADSIFAKLFERELNVDSILELA